MKGGNTLSVNKYDSTTGTLTSVAASGRVWIGTTAQHNAAIQAGTMPNNCLVSITDDESDSPADLISYDNTSSHLIAENVQDAIDEIKEILDGDTSWHTSGSIHYRKINGIVTVYTDAITSTSSSNWSTIGTLPVGYRPANNIYFNIFCDSTTDRWINFSVMATGEVQLYNNYSGNLVATATYIL